MKVRITDFLVAMGNICREAESCRKCPFNFVDEENRKGCAEGFLYDRKISEKVKDIVLKYMKEWLNEW